MTVGTKPPIFLPWQRYREQMNSQECDSPASAQHRYVRAAAAGAHFFLRALSRNRIRQDLLCLFCNASRDLKLYATEGCRNEPVRSCVINAKQENRNPLRLQPACRNVRFCRVVEVFDRNPTLDLALLVNNESPYFGLLESSTFLTAPSRPANPPALPKAIAVSVSAPSRLLLSASKAPTRLELAQ